MEIKNINLSNYIKGFTHSDDNTVTTIGDEDKAFHSHVATLFCNAVQEAGKEKFEIEKVTNDPGIDTNPAELVKAQKLLALYCTRTNLDSVIAKKFTTTIETLSKSQ